MRNGVAGKVRAAAIGALGAVGLQAVRRRLGRMDLRGRVALVTGGSRGLGLLLARGLAAEGMKVVVCARDGAELERARADLEARGADVLALACDVTDRGQVEAMVAGAIDRYGRIDVLVNNAGVIETGPLESMTLADFERAMAVIFWGALHTTFAVLPQMRARREGRIVNVTSIGGKVAVPHLLPYDAAKFAVLGFSEGLHAELAKDGIRVVTVVPGLMRTGSPLHARFKGQQRREYAWFAAGDSIPGVSMAAERAARRIILATRRGEAEVVLGLPAKAIRLAHDLFPGLTSDALGLANRFLPGPDGGSTQSAEGRELTDRPAGFLTALMRRAASRLNEGTGSGVPTS